MDPSAAADADLAWAERYSRAHELATRVEALPAGAERAVLTAFLAWRRSRLSQALDHLAAVLSPDVEPRWRARAYNTQSAVMLELGLVPEALEANDMEHRSAAEIDDRVALLRAQHDRATIMSTRNPTMAIASLTDLLAEGREAMATLPVLDAAELQQVLAVGEVNLCELYRLNDLPVPDGGPSYLSAESAASTWPELRAHVRALRAYVALQGGAVEEARTLGAGLPDPASMRDLALSVWVAIVRALLVATDDPGTALVQLAAFAHRVPVRHQAEVWRELTTLAERAQDWPAAVGYARQHVLAVETSVSQRSQDIVQALEVWLRTRRAEADAERFRQQSRVLEATLRELRESHEAIRELTVRDALTGLHNRLHLWDLGERMMAEATAERPAQVALLDLDDFKALNDTRGHVVGDDALRAVADGLGELTGPDDLCVRYGGDEFVVVRPSSSPGDLADDLAALATDARGAGVRASVGVVRAWGESLQSAIHRADQVMYVAKRAGGAAVGRS